MGVFVHHVYREEDDSLLCFMEDRRAFVCLASQIRTFARPTSDPTTMDEEQARLTVLDAACRAFESNGNLFREVHPRAPILVPEDQGMAQDLTVEDRRRLHAIIEKHHQRWFRDRPTPAQMDNLIDSIGIKVARETVEKNVAAGRVA